MQTRTDRPDAQSTVATITERNAALLARARDLFAGLDAQTPAEPRALIEQVDELQLVLLNAGSEVGVLSEVHPDLAVRESAERLAREVTRLSTSVNQSARIHDALAELDAGALDALERRMVELTLRDMRRAGAALDAMEYLQHGALRMADEVCAAFGALAQVATR